MYRLAIVSDIHYAGPRESARGESIFAPIKSRWRRWATRQYRRYIWLNDPFAHNHLFERFLQETRDADLAVANGDYSCDSAYIGISDDAALESAHICLNKLKAAFGSRLHATIGDHEIGKTMLGAEEGGLRLESYERAIHELKLEPAWKLDLGCYRLVGLTSTLLALALYEAEALPHERERWRTLRQQHLVAIRELMEPLPPDRRVLLFCHDPSALPFLAQEKFIQAMQPRLERTIIGHLHTPFIYRQSQRLAGMPPIRFLGHTPRRLSLALREARHWRAFKPLLCPSPPGIQLLKDGGYFIAHLDLEGHTPARFEFRPLPWSGT
jgi:3',5'-cyclic AMP phosphodiesterase CpdA